MPRRSQQILSLEGALLTGLRSIFSEAADQVVTELDRQGHIPTNEMSKRQVTEALESAVPEIVAVAQEGTATAAALGRNQAIDTLRKQAGVDLPFSPVPKTILDRVKESTFNASKQTMKRLTGDVNSVIQSAFEEGLSVIELRERLKDVFEGMEDWELERVARTEVQSFVNASAHETLREFGVDYEIWSAVGDNRTRESHADIDGEITHIDTPFSNGLMYPLDHRGPASEWINCRCRALPYIMGPDVRAPHTGPFRESDLIPIVGKSLRIDERYVRVVKHRGGHGGAAGGMVGTAAEIRAAKKMHADKIAGAPVPSDKDVAKARADLASGGRAGGDSRGGSAKDRREQRKNLQKEFDPEGKGYVVDPNTGLKMHWADPNYKGKAYNPKVENPNGYPPFERGKIFVKSQGGGYRLPNLLPEDPVANKARGNKPVRPENLT